MAKRQTTPARLAAASGERVKVRATKLGVYGDRRRRPGDVFTISADTQHFDRDGKPIDCPPRKRDRAGAPLPREFSTHWMEFVDADTPERTQTSVEAQRSANVDKPGSQRLKPNAADPVDEADPVDAGDEI